MHTIRSFSSLLESLAIKSIIAFQETRQHRVHYQSIHLLEKYLKHYTESHRKIKSNSLYDPLTLQEKLVKMKLGNTVGTKQLVLRSKV